MLIRNLRTNRINNPLGFALDRPALSWIIDETDAKTLSWTRIEISNFTDFSHLLFDSGRLPEVDSICYRPELKLVPMTRYYWRVSAAGDNGESAVSETAWFETGRMDLAWQAQWITPDLDPSLQPIMKTTFTAAGQPTAARLYICGLGVYEASINGKKTGDEYLAPGYHSYDFWLQAQTYDVTTELQAGENTLSVMLGDGWYKGRFCFNGGYTDLYGDKLALIAELHIQYADGTRQVVVSDLNWQSAAGPVLASNIYDGETYDARLEIPEQWQGVKLLDGMKMPQDRLSLPVKIKETVQPVAIIQTPAGETVLDMGQNMTGWVRFKNTAPAGQQMILTASEILQQGNFYRDNLREAKAEFRYTSNGQTCWVEPRFTFYGFRYLKLEGFDSSITLNDFVGCVLYSDLESAGSITTSDERLNRLFQNALWSQKGNFLDVPTDCPQRDERMGWTGDAQVFSATACFNMDSQAFYSKYLHDLGLEQAALGGSVPNVVPMPKPADHNPMVMGHGSTAWGEAATVIPWNLYQFYGDKEVLRRHLPIMKGWVDYLRSREKSDGGNRLLQKGFHFGDWLALDNPDPKAMVGGTDAYLIASAYYAYSSELVSKAAAELGETAIAAEYSQLAGEIRQAIQNEYYSANGKSTNNTQTAMVIALYMNLLPEAVRPRVARDLVARLAEDNNHLKTGFVGTPYLCPVLSANGYPELAWTLLLNDDFPSWLYEVKLGATTIWERWNSVLPDGSISETGMNSLNHYAYGSIAEWMYRYMCGINLLPEAPGFRAVAFKPQPYGRLRRALGKVESAAGTYQCGWRIGDDGLLTVVAEVPFGVKATITLPDSQPETINIRKTGNQSFDSVLEGEAVAGDLTANLKSTVSGKDSLIELSAGRWVFQYQPTRSYLIKYGLDTKVSDLLANSETRKVLDQYLPELFAGPAFFMEFRKDKALGALPEMNFGGLAIAPEKLAVLQSELGKILRYTPV